MWARFIFTLPLGSKRLGNAGLTEGALNRNSIHRDTKFDDLICRHSPPGNRDGKPVL
jgi:hypothetical protein